MKKTVATLGALSCALSLSLPASAAGLFFPDRGVRPLARGGAFVAGGDDLGAIAYNVAGTYDAGSQLFADYGVVLFSTEFTRTEVVRQYDPNSGEEIGKYLQTYPTVNGSAPPLPIPTLVASYQPHEQWVLSLGAWAPYAALMSYPEKVNGQAAPQRYSLITLNGSALMDITAAAAYAPSKEWRFGLALTALVGAFRTEVDFSGCVPERFVCAPQDPAWDVRAEMNAAPIIAPSGSLGAIWIPEPWIRFGASFQAPTYVRTSAKLHTRLPSTPVFEKASQEGDDATIAFDLPWNVRAGVEVRPTPKLRVELDGGFEKWSMHDEIRVHAEGIALKDVAAFPEVYYVPDINLPRGFQDTFIGRLGAEYIFDADGKEIALRAGGSYETSAVPPEWLHVLALDSAKVTGAVGAGIKLGKVRLDATFAHMQMANIDVDPESGKITQVSPVRANPSDHPVVINGGHYAAHAEIIGVGILYQLDDVPEAYRAETPRE